MEQKTKKFEELDCYERAIASAALEKKLEAMAQEASQIAMALKMSVNVMATYYLADEKEKTAPEVALLPTGTKKVASRSAKHNGDLFGIIDQATKLKYE